MVGGQTLASACNGPSGPPIVSQIIGAGTITTNSDVKRVCINVVAGPVQIDGQAVSVGMYCFGDLFRGPLGYELVVVAGAAANITITQED